jgi:transcriptional regulator GlxA family with amidase domain
MSDQAANDTRAPETSDSHVARAIAAMKAEPSRRWTVGALARIAGLSRAAFARRFTQAMGVAPFRWLTEHRLGLARGRLAESDVGLAAVAAEIGYESEFAFAKAFKRLFGIAPGLFRRTALERGRRPVASAFFRAAA